MNGKLCHEPLDNTMSLTCEIWAKQMHNQPGIPSQEIPSTCLGHFHFGIIKNLPNRKERIIGRRVYGENVVCGSQ